jgi:hypothetical protein
MVPEPGNGDDGRRGQQDAGTPVNHWPTAGGQIRRSVSRKSGIGLMQ